MINFWFWKKKKEPEKPVQMAEVKTFNRKVDIMFLDDKMASLTRQLMAGAKLEALNPVPLLSEDRNVGAATVYIENNVLVADIFMLYDCPERLDIQNDVKYYAYFKGYSETVDVGNLLKVLKIFVKSVYLTKEPNKDDRIAHI